MVPLIRPNGHLLPEGEGKPFRLVTVFYSVSRKYSKVTIQSFSLSGRRCLIY
jgi:hypothetical protein